MEMHFTRARRTHAHCENASPGIKAGNYTRVHTHTRTSTRTRARTRAKCSCILFSAIFDHFGKYNRMPARLQPTTHHPIVLCLRVRAITVTTLHCHHTITTTRATLAACIHKNLPPDVILTVPELHRPPVPPTSRKLSCHCRHRAQHTQHIYAWCTRVVCMLVHALLASVHYPHTRAIRTSVPRAFACLVRAHTHALIDIKLKLGSRAQCTRTHARMYILVYVYSRLYAAQPSPTPKCGHTSCVCVAFLYFGPLRPPPPHVCTITKPAKNARDNKYPHMRAPCMYMYTHECMCMCVCL